MSEKLTMHVPLHFEGEEDAPGVKAGGVVSKTVTDLEVKCLPTDLPEFIAVDISSLEMDQSLHLSHIKLPKGVEFAHEEVLDEAHDHQVVSIHEPRVEAEPEPEAEADAEAADAEEGAEAADDADKAADGADEAPAAE